MLKTTPVRFKKLKELQPELLCLKSRISGCFHLSATYDFNSKDEAKSKFHVFPYNRTNRAGDPGFIYEYFYISATLTSEKKYLRLKVFETNGKLDSWKRKIPSKYWHFYEDGSFCLGKDEELKNHQKRFGEKFEKYFVYIISDFLYHMAYIERHGIEPWKGDRHGIFELLEYVVKCDLLELKAHHSSIERLIHGSREWKQLTGRILSYTRGKLEIENSHPCPFCFLDEKDRKAGECDVHKEDIEGFNRIVELIFEDKLIK